jgi:hypothetical protein
MERDGSRFLPADCGVRKRFFFEKKNQKTFAHLVWGNMRAGQQTFGVVNNGSAILLGGAFR